MRQLFKFRRNTLYMVVDGNRSGGAMDLDYTLITWFFFREEDEIGDTERAIKWLVTEELG